MPERKTPSLGSGAGKGLSRCSERSATSEESSERADCQFPFPEFLIYRVEWKAQEFGQLTCWPHLKHHWSLA